MRKLKVFLLASVLFLSVCLPSYSVDYLITEKQLIQLEQTFLEQSEVVEKQNEQLEMQLIQMQNLKEQLDKVSQSYKKFENKKFIEMILVGVGCFVVGGLTVGVVMTLK